MLSALIKRAVASEQWMTLLAMGTRVTPYLRKLIPLLGKPGA